MKYFLLVLLALQIISCIAYSDYSVMFLGIDPSSINRAIGGDAVGVVNIWHRNALTSYYNPAIPAFHDGVSYGFTHTPWLKTADINNIYYNGGLATIGYMGIAVTMPAPVSGNIDGLNIDYGIQEITNEVGVPVASYRSYEYATPYGLAINPIQTYRFITGNSVPDSSHFNMAVGFQTLSIKSKLAPYSIEGALRTSAKANTTNIGLILQYHLDYEKISRLEAVYGLASFNVFDDKIGYGSETQKDPVFSHVNHGFGISYSLLGENALKDKIPKEWLFFENLMTLRGLTSFIYDDYDKEISAFGVEVGFLDTFYYRMGIYNDNPDEKVENTHGYGINLHYKNILSLEYNHATWDMGHLVNDQESDDYNVSFDLDGIYHWFH
ncbi:MAG TPA: hypothetical protein PLE74_08775 [Candidatus Cloacimonadota bacterium]|nr:hypothetical protein [Candidatus Cloacimonadota bacterium]HPT72360.1 hypothetical protein [Candidatus Cloacimonadota bacterium]